MMSFGQAFGYPFKSIPKILTIVLVFTILVVLLIANYINSRSDDALLLFTAVTILSQTLFLSGYGIRIIRQVQAGDSEHLPAFDVFKDLGRGVVVVVAGIVSLLPLIFLFFCGVGMMARSLDGGYAESSSSTILSILLLIPLILYWSWGLYVGMLRYAAEERAGAMFEFSANFSRVNNNFGAMFSLLGYQILLAIIYYVVNLAVTFLYDVVFTDSITFQTDDTTLIAIVSVGAILSIMISLFQQFAWLHLVAQLGDKIGITDDFVEEKLKY